MAAASASGDSAAVLAATAAALAAHGMEAAPAGKGNTLTTEDGGMHLLPPVLPAAPYRIPRKPTQPGIPSTVPMRCSAAAPAVAVAATSATSASVPAAPPNSAGATAPPAFTAPHVVQQQPTFAAVSAISVGPSAYGSAVPPAGAPAVASASQPPILNHTHPAVRQMMEDGLTQEEAIAIVAESLEDGEGMACAPHRPRALERPGFRPQDLR